MSKRNKQLLSPEQFNQLLAVLKDRFSLNIHLHKGLNWEDLKAKLDACKRNNSAGLWSLNEMEQTGGEPDVVAYDQKTGEWIFYDCATESPKGRRSICYDNEALHARKENKPKDSAVGMAASMGISILNEEQYRHLQTLGCFDAKTSSWIETPEAIRKLGGALFCDWRYNHVFTYHNGAESYYAARGFRGLLRV